MKSLLLLSLAGCLTQGALSESDEQDTTATSYLSFTDFAGADVDGFFGLQGKLAGEFTALCGGSFCTGEYADLTPLSIACSVTSKLGDVHDCTWTFGGSRVAVNPTTAALAIDAPTFACHFGAKTTGNKLIALLNNATDALHTPLPGGTATIFDGLASCFQHPIDTTPVTNPTATKVTYVEATDYYSAAASVASWQAVQANVKRGFDYVCGDTFCGSDYGDLQALDLVCAVTKSTGNVKGCNWIFAGSYAGIGKSGAVVPNTKSFACPIAMKGTLPQLIAVINAPPSVDNSSGYVEVIQRPLPGMTTSLYDEVGGCLP